MPRIKVGEGLIHYEDRGADNGAPGGDDAGALPTILFIIGLAGRGVDWTPRFFDKFAGRFRCIAADHRGCGSSDLPTGEVSIRSMAEDAAGLLDALGIESAHVVGMSLGGMIAQRLAIHHPGRVRTLTLASTTIGGRRTVPPEPDIQELLANPKAGLAALESTITALTAPGYPEREPEAFAEFIARFVERPTPFRVMMAQWMAIQSDDRFEEAAGIGAPTLVVTGDRDRLVPPGNAPILADRIPGARLATIQDCGHMISLERPDELEALMEPMLALSFAKNK